MKPQDPQQKCPSSAHLTSLMEDYPDLAQGLDHFLEGDTTSVVASVGIFTLLQLRLRAVLAHLPQMAPEEPSTTPGASRSS